MGCVAANDEKYTELVRETIRELDDIMKVSPRDRVKDLAKSALGRSVRTKDPMFWPAGMLLLGLAEARNVLFFCASEADATSAESAGKAAALIEDIDAALLRHLHLWKDKYGGKIEYIDDALAAAALLKMSYGDGDSGTFSEIRSGEESCVSPCKCLPGKELSGLCRLFADRMYAYLQNAPRDDDGIIVYNASKSSSIFADGIGQTSMFLSLYGRCFGEDRALDLAKKQLLGFMKNGMDEKSHLPYHGFARGEDGSIEKKGVLSWGRAAGWLIMGLSEYVRCMRMERTSGADADGAGADDTLLLDWYKELTTALLTYTRPDGGYSWQVQAIDGHLDTSATGMILYGILNGCGCAQKDMTRGRELFDRETSDGKVGNALSSCDDFGVHYQTYGNYPWGQGAGLAFVSLFMERI
jgi:hypothetical protein